jgi:hypothetical protein
VLGYFVNMRAEQQAQEQIAKADELYNAGSRAEAVAIYKETFPHAQRGSRGRMVARIVGYALESGDKAAADQWVRRAVDDDLPIAEYDQAAGQAVADAKQAIEAERERKRIEAERRQREAQVASEVLGKPAFDVPSLIGKSIDEVRGVLGKPDDREPEPTKLQLQIGVDEWINSYEKDGQELMVTFNPRNRVVIDFFLEGDSKAVLMQIANLREGDSAYRVEVIQAINAPGQITGIKVVPIRQSSTMRIEMQIEQKGVPAPPTSENKSVAKPMRTWTDTSGQFSVTASFAGYAFGKVKLRKEDGSVIEVEFAKLSLADQGYVNSFR